MEKGGGQVAKHLEKNEKVAQAYRDENHLDNNIKF